MSSSDSTHDRPTATELVAAVREFLERDVMQATEGRTAFHARVAVNVLAMVERELAGGPAQSAAERRALAELLGHDRPLGDLQAELAAGIRDGSLDGRRAEVIDHVRGTVRAKLEVANPKYLEKPTA